MAPDGPCVSPPMAPGCTAEDFLAIVTRAAITGLGPSTEAGEVDEACVGALKRCVK